MAKATTRAAAATRGRKRPVNLTLDAELVERAQRMTGNLSAQVESLLEEFVEKREAEDQARAARSDRAARSWNAFAERHGSFADEFSTL
jgi:post-segregation antitoxin (ccd killing protein)